MRRFGQHGEIVHPDDAPFLRNEINRLPVVGHPFHTFTAVNNGSLHRFRQNLVLRAHAAVETARTFLRGDDQIARLLELLRVGGIDAVAPVFQRRADHVARRVNQQKRAGLLLRVEETSPRLRQRSVLGLPREHAQRSPLICDGELVAPVVRRIDELSIKVLDVRDICVPQRRQQVELDHRRHNVIGRHNHIVKRRAAALDFGQHALHVFEEINIDLAVELLLKVSDDRRINVFAPDEKIERLLLGLHAKREQQNNPRNKQDFPHTTV